MYCIKVIRNLDLSQKDRFINSVFNTFFGFRHSGFVRYFMSTQHVNEVAARIITRS